MDVPTLEQFISASRASGLYSYMTDKDLEEMYNLLVGPPEPFLRALQDWAENTSITSTTSK